jgi:hypothetical protein
MIVPPEGGQLHEVASVERQILHLFFIDHAAEHRRLGFQQRRGALDHDALADEADVQIEVDLRALIDLQFHARALDLAKPRQFRAQPVAAGLQRCEAVGAAFTRRDRAADAGRFVGQRDGDAGHDGAGTVFDRSDQIRGGDLRAYWRRRNQQERTEGEKREAVGVPRV